MRRAAALLPATAINASATGDTINVCPGGYFEQVFGGDSFERRKPDPLPLLKTCEALGTKPERTLMVGDPSNDAQAARAAGCPVWLLSYGYNHGEPIHAVDADGVVDSIAQLS